MVAILLHCDRCDQTTEVRWTDGQAVLTALEPDGWGVVNVPKILAERRPGDEERRFVVCPDCLALLNTWIDGRGAKG